jgi:hypothetical protein
MEFPNIIGLTGLAGCGKDTVALILKAHVRFNHLAFADPLRSEICAAYKAPNSLFTNRATKETPVPELALKECLHNEFVGQMLRLHAMRDPAMSLKQVLEAPRSPRELMRWWGTEFRRETTHQNYWTRLMISRVKGFQDGQEWRQVISDVRFPNEAETVRAMGGKIWQVKRPGMKRDASHVSETDGSEFAPDFVIDNRGDLDFLRYVVLSAWLMREASISAHDVMRMGIAMVPEANAEFLAAGATGTPAQQTTGVPA